MNLAGEASRRVLPLAEPQRGKAYSGERFVRICVPASAANTTAKRMEMIQRARGMRGG